ncbi:MAG: hypothetical protein A2W91_11615 [Bacteroidetes bacterium GWF2_38_335]|nr:MAG: hypothetical protein A2W91_11615 [Bacteroidetes bacterium GWF2_38_335]OFY77927.1 MAG: hypothetical protein A2281_18360 [Bacteroidetes bacterium RIFOXYA12_FULL_38_20]HBS86667.1 aminoacetone oxidase family FAD-binding enzyme [Bacteroidales bacterium]
MNKFDTIIIGGGASGLLAAGVAAGKGKKVLVLEKMSRPGRKLAITGKGRCNLTNMSGIEEFLAEIKPENEFLRHALTSFGNRDLVEFFDRIGIKTKLERGNRVFPQNDSAPEVVEKLVAWCKKQGAEFITGFRVDKLVIENKIIRGVLGPDGAYFSNSVIIATGGSSYPATGSTGDGYKFAEKAGHTVSKILPALVPLETSFDTKRLAGLELKNINLKVIVEGKTYAEEFGDMTFLETGLSGPIILTQSREIVKLIDRKVPVRILLDLKPALSQEKLERRIERDFEARKNDTFRSVLNGLLPMKLIPVCISQIKIPAEKRAGQINSLEKGRLINWLKTFRMEIKGYRPFAEAIITSGGVSTREINPKTMESRLIRGLFFTGEVIDLDGPTGGYNLQIAFSTGFVAGNSQ